MGYEGGDNNIIGRKKKRGSNKVKEGSKECKDNKEDKEG